MRIGILTLPLHTNYGGILQAYALQTVLERMGHEVKVIEERRNFKVPLWKKPLSYTKRAIEKYVLKKQVRIFAEKYDKFAFPIVTQYTRRFIENNIHLLWVDKLESLKETQFDAIIVGSDQIWRPKYYSNIHNAFLWFARNWNIKRLSYAASFGSAEWEYSKHETAKCRKLLSYFDFISVREESGCVLCEKYLNHKAFHVLDPTLLLKVEDYLRFIDKKETPSGKNLMIYILDQNSNILKKIQEFASRHGFYPFKANSRFEDFFAPIDERIQPPLESWLNGFVNSELVITDSFHACIFSIIFRKDFFVICNNTRGNDRFISLLDLIGLSDRIIKSIDYINDVKHAKINFNKVHSILDRKRNESIKLLSNGLSNK